ncbi:hypothetical protein M2404_003508 [Rheinheimera pacifica]|uniref:hypothetical protein n=1 Tax=Rheinheimera pacifica TaxID=173990 RepID=UPI0021680B52|nr:hypothetical protein [Rheinheimera pacifica]MCS4309145.1 hypothetical protein [Rheinheimera pacifica]
MSKSASSYKWGFIIKGPRSALDYLLQNKNVPWWKLMNRGGEWEAWLPDVQHETCPNAQFDLVQQSIVRMNGLLNSRNLPGLIEMTHFVNNEAEQRTVSIPLPLVIRVTNLGGLGAVKHSFIDFSCIEPADLSNLKNLMDYWGQPNAETYEGLYKIYEWIQSIRHDLVTEIPKKQRERLTHTCNHWSSGPTARHATRGREPPKNPMPLREIKQIVMCLSDSYVQSVQSSVA